MTNCLCKREYTIQSADSPGIVADDEPIVLALIYPDDYKDGSIRGLNHTRLKKQQLSVVRAKYSSGENAHANTVERLLQKDPARQDRGYMYALGQEIRAILLAHLKCRAFCLIDETVPDFAAHAHVGYSCIENDKRNDRLAARGDLLNVFLERGIFTEWSGAPFMEDASEGAG
ncbi:MAG: hypothetical protein CML31_14715 [Rhizobiales bacterium]|nr:hypothetical protein [Hyphomicrobiales bacterium]